VKHFAFQFLIGSLKAHRSQGFLVMLIRFSSLLGNLEAVPKLIRALSLLFQFLIGSLDAL